MLLRGECTTPAAFHELVRLRRMEFNLHQGQHHQHQHLLAQPGTRPASLVLVKNNNLTRALSDMGTSIVLTAHPSMRDFCFIPCQSNFMPPEERTSVSKSQLFTWRLKPASSQSMYNLVMEGCKVYQCCFANVQELQIAPLVREAAEVAEAAAQAGLKHAACTSDSHSSCSMSMEDLLSGNKTTAPDGMQFLLEAVDGGTSSINKCPYHMKDMLIHSILVDILDSELLELPSCFVPYSEARAREFATIPKPVKKASYPQFENMCGTAFLYSFWLPEQSQRMLMIQDAGGTRSAAAPETVAAVVDALELEVQQQMESMMEQMELDLGSKMEADDEDEHEMVVDEGEDDEEDDPQPPPAEKLPSIQEVVTAYGNIVLKKAYSGTLITFKVRLCVSARA